MQALRPAAALLLLIGMACSRPDKATHAESGPPAVRSPQLISNQQSAISSQQSAISNQQSAVSFPTESVSLHLRQPVRPFEVTVRTAEPGAAHFRRFGTISLRTSLRARTADLGQYPCTSCHLGRALVLADERVGDAHQNIESVHPVQTGGLCSTCHAPDNVELLALKSGERATLDHTYRLCAQCHFSQAEAWAGGAHGKRVDGWRGPRVVMGCADCHDPHKPALEPRVPFQAPRIRRAGGEGR